MNRKKFKNKVTVTKVVTVKRGIFKREKEEEVEEEIEEEREKQIKEFVKIKIRLN